jgi:hypothetical protein
MFERYTEKARRVIFFARYEASQFGSPVIDSEHLLLGLLRENKNLRQWMPKAEPETIRNWVEAETPRRTSLSTAIDLPLSASSKKILKFAMNEADRLAHRHIGTEHLFLAFFAVEDCLAAKLLRQAGADAATIRAKLTEQSEHQEGFSLRESLFGRTRRVSPVEIIEIHGSRRNADYIRDVVSMIRSYNWHWHKTGWKPHDLVINRKDGKFSFELGLAADTENFTLVEKGWKKDHCFICRWELFESDDEHGTGYTNGRNWLCTECCERFLHRDFFSSSHPEIT